MKTITQKLAEIFRKLQASAFGTLFLDKRFLNYAWVGVLISSINVFLLWLFIDVLGIATVTSGIIVVAATFIFRYILLVLFKIF